MIGVSITQFASVCGARTLSSNVKKHLMTAEIWFLKKNLQNSMGWKKNWKMVFQEPDENHWLETLDVGCQDFVDVRGIKHEKY